MGRTRTDDELVRDCNAGVSEAWGELATRYGKVIYGAIYATLSKYGLERRADLADETYQLVFTEFWEKKRLQSLRETRLLRSFLVSAAVTRTIDGVRVMSRHDRRHVGEADPDLAAKNGHNPREAAREAEVRAAIETEIASLPSKEAYMLRMATEHGLTHAQIAELMDVPRDTASTVIRRAKEKIRESLKRKGIAEF